MKQTQHCECMGLTVHMLRVCNSIQSGHLENPYVSRLPVHHGVKSRSRGIHQQLQMPCMVCVPTLPIPPWSSLDLTALAYTAWICLGVHISPSLVAWPASFATFRPCPWLPSPSCKLLCSALPISALSELGSQLGGSFDNLLTCCPCCS